MKPTRLSGSPFIVNRRYDWAFFMLPPLLSLGIGCLVSRSDFAHRELIVAGTSTTILGLFLGTLVHAHLGAVFFRSHGNPSILRKYPTRFVLVPILLWIAVVSSAWIAVLATVVATFWDVWHSGAQTFGFGRLYDRNLGNEEKEGRKLDFWLNQLLYAGPVLAGITLHDHLQDFENFREVGSLFFAAIPAYVESSQRYLVWGVLAAGTVFLLYYLYAHWRFHRQGRRISFHKIFLLTSTGLCSIYTWGFNTWGEAFFIMNLFHAVQYLALMWVTEGKRIARGLRIPQNSAGRLAGLAGFLGLAFAYGFAAEVLSEGLDLLWAATMVVSLMHFWYDGFIWSVRRREI